MTINSSVISNNVVVAPPESSRIGGGIYNEGFLTINNSIISGNMAGEGAGIYNNFYPFANLVKLNNSTVSNNAARGGFYGGGGIWSGGIMTLQNTILVGNSSDFATADCIGSIDSLGYNLLGNTSGCIFTPSNGDLIGVDPMLDLLQNNGGSTFTHALLPGSPAIDAGNPAGCTDQDGNLLTTDQRGVARPQGTHCDIGAFELEGGGGGGTEVTIDIKPGSQTNPINIKSRGNIPVAILSTPDFNAPAMVNKTSLTFGKTGDEQSLAFCNKRGQDVNGDRLLDLVCHFKTRLTGFQLGDTEGILKGLTVDGISIEGRDAVRIVPPSYP